jgi:hypothetical protein
MLTTAIIESDLRTLRVRGHSFMGGVLVNNRRYKELCFTLKRYDAMVPCGPDGGGERPCRIAIEIDVELDSLKGQVRWHYAQAAMQAEAEHTFIDERHQVTLHQALVRIFRVNAAAAVKEGILL